MKKFKEKEFKVVLDTITKFAKVSHEGNVRFVNFDSLLDEWHSFTIGEDVYDIHVYNEGDSIEATEISIYDVDSIEINTQVWHKVKLTLI